MNSYINLQGIAEDVSDNSRSKRCKNVFIILVVILAARVYLSFNAGLNGTKMISVSMPYLICIIVTFVMALTVSKILSSYAAPIAGVYYVSFIICIIAVNVITLDADSWIIYGNYFLPIATLLLIFGMKDMRKAALIASGADAVIIILEVVMSFRNNVEVSMAMAFIAYLVSAVFLIKWNIVQTKKWISILVVSVIGILFIVNLTVNFQRWEWTNNTNFIAIQNEKEYELLLENTDGIGTVNLNNVKGLGYTDLKENENKAIINKMVPYSVSNYSLLDYLKIHYGRVFVWYVYGGVFLLYRNLILLNLRSCSGSKETLLSYASMTVLISQSVFYIAGNLFTETGILCQLPFMSENYISAVVNSVLLGMIVNWKD